MKRLIAAGLAFLPGLLFAQDFTYGIKFELRGNYRDSNEQKFPLRTPFPPINLPVGQTVGFEQTVDGGSHAELSVADIQLDLGYGKWFAARTKFHAVDKYRRNPTSEDRMTDADELWIRFGENPQFLARPEKTSFFIQLGKAPKMERQPIRLLESYGLASTAFNRFEDIQAIGGGSIGRNFYWRLQGGNGNPLYFRDPNALAGDNGIQELLQPNPDPELKSGFPIFYNAETEGYFFNSSNLQFGEGLGYKWQNDAQTMGFDVLAFHYRRTMPYSEHLTGTFYGTNIDLIDGPEVEGLHFGIPTNGDKKEETGARLYSEWGQLTVMAQYTHQEFTGLERNGWEVESGYSFSTEWGWLRTIQPAARWSGLQPNYRAIADKRYPAPSVWWPWTKIDAGIRIGFVHGFDVTIERAKHLVGSPRKLDLGETLVTLRLRV